MKNIRISGTTLAWLQSDDGIQALTERLHDSINIFSEPGLIERLRRESEAGKAGGSKVFRIGNSLRALSTELTILTFAHGSGLKIASEVWEVARSVGAAILALDNLSFQGRSWNPPRQADLWTADIGINVAFVLQNASPLDWDKVQVGRFLETYCSRPISTEWLDDATRIHSLDSMGHNWWSVIVGGAGIVDALLNRNEPAMKIGIQLEKWFSYPGNGFGRKTRNFGDEGDFVEGFAYGEYALLHPFILAFLLPEFSINPAWLNSRQMQGLATWYKKAFLKGSDGKWRPQRFGDIQLSYMPRAEVWHTLARLTEDEELLIMAHQLKSQPRSIFEFLMWEPLSRKAAYRPQAVQGEPTRIFPTSGLALLGADNLSLTVRAGEFWNHNHQDAGSFIFHQDGVCWVDDSGCCVYSLPEYVNYYVTPQAHNVAYASDLVPPNPMLVAYEGLPLPGKVFFHGRLPGLEILGIDTQVLSGDALARSHRVFFVLDNAATVIWDDLQAHHPQSFDFLLHTLCAVRPTKQGMVELESGDGKSCPLIFFSENPSSFSVEAAPMGEVSQPDSTGHTFLPGKCLKWRGEKALRQKFGLTMGTTVGSARWLSTDSGWENSFQLGQASWSIWFNHKADGRVMHESPIATWRGIETDAYALLLRDEGDRKTLYGIQASFLRREGTVIAADLQRSILSKIDF